MRFKHINENEGLSYSTVNDIIQDYLGFIWIATGDGLNCYNGYDMKVYKNVASDTTSIIGNFIGNLLEDNKKRLWIIAGETLNQYDRNNDNFIHYNLPEETGTTINGIICEDKNEVLWLATYGGLTSYDINTGKYTFHPDSTSIKDFKINNNIQTFCFDNNHTIYLSEGSGSIRSFDIELKKFQSLEGIIHTRSQGYKINDLMLDQNNNLWVSTLKNGILKFNLETRKVKQFVAGSKNNSVNETYNDGNIIYAATGKGLFKYNNEKEEFIKINLVTSTRNDTEENEIYSIYKDRTNNLWLGTSTSGVFEIPHTNNLFRHLSKSKDGLPGKIVMAMIEDRKENIWFGLYGGGLAKYDKKKNVFKSFVHNPKDKKSISSNNIAALLEDEHGIIWLSTFYSGINKFNPVTEAFNLFGGKKNENYPWDFVTVIFEDAGKNLWFGSNNRGIFLYDKKKNQIYKFKNEPANPRSTGSNYGKAIVEDEFNNIWIGTSRPAELEKFNRKDFSFTHFKIPLTDRYKVENNPVTFMYNDNKGTLWIGTFSTGLIKFDIKTEKFSYVVTNSELDNQNINGILEDEQNHLWVSTNHGLFSVNKSTLKTRRFTVNDGILNNEFNGNSCLKTKSGEMYFGGSEGVTYFKPEEVYSNSSDDPVILTGLKVLNKTVKISPNSPLNININLAREINLTYEDYFFQFEFAALNYNNNKDIQYAYKMEGLNKEWVTTTAKQRFATFTHLNSGKYTFKVTTVQNGIPSLQNEASVVVIISPPYYETWWFYSLLFLVFILIIYLLYRSRVNKIRELESLRLKIASDLHDDIGANLTKLALKVDVIKQDVSDCNKTELTRVSEMSRESIDMMRDIVWSIDSRNDKFEDLLNKMKDFSFGVLRDKGIKVNFITKGFHPSQKMSIDIRQNLFLILKEAVNNIAKHSNTENVEIEIESDRKVYSMIIKDYGTNFREKETNAGQGLKNMKYRATKINAEIHFYNDDGFKIELKGRLEPR